MDVGVSQSITVLWSLFVGSTDNCSEYVRVPIRDRVSSSLVWVVRFDAQNIAFLRRYLELIIINIKLTDGH